MAAAAWAPQLNAQDEAAEAGAVHNGSHPLTKRQFSLSIPWIHCIRVLASGYSLRWHTFLAMLKLLSHAHRDPRQANTDTTT